MLYISCSEDVPNAASPCVLFLSGRVFFGLAATITGHYLSRCIMISRELTSDVRLAFGPRDPR